MSKSHSTSSSTVFHLLVILVIKSSPFAGFLYANIERERWVLILQFFPNAKLCYPRRGAHGEGTKMGERIESEKRRFRPFSITDEDVRAKMMASTESRIRFQYSMYKH